jgi:putative Holliday junction resolvase
MPGTPETIIALDFGRRRIGVAIGQTITASASPAGFIRNTRDGPDWHKISEIIAEWQPDCIVVGLPLHADGTASEMSEHVTAFVAELVQLGLPVHMQDERHTSQEAQELLKNERAMGLRGRIRKETVDSTAAVLIAERWLSQKS